MTLPDGISPEIHNSPLPSLLSRRAIPFYQKSLTVPLILGLICFLVYNMNLRQIGTGDTVSARYLPLLIWRNGTFNFDANIRLVAHGHPMGADRSRLAGAGDKITFFEPTVYWMVGTYQQQRASVYPVVTPVLVAPLYLPAVIWLNMHGWEQPQVDRVAE